MEQQRDEQLHCADCGASFVFSANEAAVFAERGLSPPKRCKECRRARKERATRDGAGDRNGRDGGSPPPWQGRGGAPRHGAPRRYTGDVNEYRSPMGDSFSGSPYGMPARGGAWQGSGEYRSPMPDGNLRRGPEGDPRAARPPRHDGNFRPAERRDGGARPRPAPPATNGHAPKAPRKRPAAELFPITCNACGAQAEVPFKPADGREVYCPTCYRARRPSP